MSRLPKVIVCITDMPGWKVFDVYYIGYQYVTVYILEENLTRTPLASGIRTPDGTGYSVYNIYTNAYIYAILPEEVGPLIVNDIPGISHLEIEVFHGLPKDAGPYT